MAACAIQIGVNIFATYDKIHRTCVQVNEKNMRGNLFPRIVFGRSKTLSRVIGSLITFLVNNASLGLQNPVISSAEEYTRSLHAGYEMIGAFVVKRDISATDHIWTVK